VNIELTVVDVPAELNPEGLRVEYSSIGHKSEGKFQLYYDFADQIWRSRGDMRDDSHYLTARLVEPLYTFNGDKLTKEQCRDALNLGYAQVSSDDYEDYLHRTDAQNLSPCSGCPFYVASNCKALPESLRCATARVWVPRDVVEEMRVTSDAPQAATTHPELAAEAARAVRPLFSVNEYDSDGEQVAEGIFLHFGNCRVLVATTLAEFREMVAVLDRSADEIERDYYIQGGSGEK